MPENYISKVKLPGNETIYDIRAHKTAGIYYAQVDSTSTSTKFTATIADLNIDAYYDGLTVLLYNGKVTSASGFTININGLGAKPSYSNMALGNPTTPTDPTRDTTIFNINYAMLFVYNSTRVSGGCWICYRGYDANTNTIGYQLRSNNTTMPTTDKFYRYRLLFTSADHNHWVPANTSTSTNATAKRDTIQRPIDPFGEIVWYGTTTAIEANANVTAAQLWQEYYGSYTAIGYSFNRTGAAPTMTANRPIFIKCAPQSDGSAIIDADTPYVQALPNSEDGKIYIFLGRAYNATNFEILMNHPVYYYKDGAIRLWSNAAQVSNIPTKTSDLTNDGEDGTSTYVEASDLATVATSGLYNDLIGLPTIPTVGTLNTTNTTAQTPAAAESLSGTVNLHKVSKTGNYNDLINKIPNEEKTILALPVKQQSDDYVICPTVEAERWQYALQENIDPTTYVVSEWITRNEFIQYLYNYQLCIWEMIATSSGVAGVNVYTSCIQVNDDGIDRTIEGFRQQSIDSHGSVEVQFANLNTDQSITAIASLGANNDPIYGMVGHIPTTIRINSDLIVIVALINFLSRSHDWQDGSSLLSKFESSYSDKLNTILKSGKGYLNFVLPDGSSFMLELSQIIATPVIAGSGYLVFPHNDTVLEGLIKVLFYKDNDAWQLDISSYVPNVAPYITAYATYSNNTWSLNPTLSEIWNSITDMIDHMDVLPAYRANNISIYYDGKFYPLVNWSGSTGDWTLVFENSENNTLSQFVCSCDNQQYTITYTQFPLRELPVVTSADDGKLLGVNNGNWVATSSSYVSRSDFTSVTASHVTSGTSFNTYNGGGVVSQTSFSSSKGFTVAEGTVTAVSCYSSGGAVSQTSFTNASITPYTATDVTAVNLT